MSRDQEFEKIMETLFEMSRYITVYENTPRRYQSQDLYMTEAHALSLIATQEGMNLTQLARQSNRTKGATSQMVEKLRKRGLVEKLQSPNNASELILRLTEEGWAVYHYHHDLEKRAYGVLLKRMPDFTEEEFQSCLRVMEGIKRAASSRWNEKK